MKKYQLIILICAIFALLFLQTATVSETADAIAPATTEARRKTIGDVVPDGT